MPSAALEHRVEERVLGIAVVARVAPEAERLEAGTRAARRTSGSGSARASSSSRAHSRSTSRPGCACAARQSAATSRRISAGRRRDRGREPFGGIHDRRRYPYTRTQWRRTLPARRGCTRPSRYCCTASQQRLTPTRKLIVDVLEAADRPLTIPEILDAQPGARPELGVPEPRRARTGPGRAPARDPRRLRALRAGRGPHRSPPSSRVLELRPRRRSPRDPGGRALGRDRDRRGRAARRASGPSTTGSISSACAPTARR